MLLNTAIPLVALGISALTFLALRRKASEDRVSGIEQRCTREIRALREALLACHAERDALQREKLMLLERLFQRGPPHAPPG